jgi:rRNA-processing protein FCF1
METIIVILLLIIAAEATYLVANSGKKQINKKAGHPIFVDTSVLIDGRIIAVAQSGFIGSDTLFIPRSVIGELQFLDDNGDGDKRSRARHGLDLVSELQAMTDVKVEIFQDGSKAEEGVDERLLKLAKQYNGSICTIDYNLNKVAQVEHIKVLNVNDLAMSLRMAYLPGEKILLELTQKGQDNHQAVGHLADGTMVVVEHANKFSLQTAAGKMMFAKLVDNNVTTKETFKKPQPKQIPTPAVVSAPPVSAIFHSDQNDQRLATRAKRTDTRQPYQPRQNNNTQVINNQTPKQARVSKKPRSSAQNEDDLIKLLNNQE